MRQHHTLAALLLFTTFGLTACAFGTIGPERDINDPTNSLVFGYIDMDDAPTSLDWASIKQAYPIGEEGYWNMAADDGLFFQPYLPPKAGYQLASFGGSSFLGGDVRYNFPDYGNESGLMIKQPGIYFLGAFKYVEVDTGWLEADKFQMEPVQSPTELELLRRILQDDDIEDSPVWQKRIKARIAELER